MGRGGVVFVAFPAVYRPSLCSRYPRLVLPRPRQASLRPPAAPQIPIDTKYYLDNQLQGPLTRIFEPIIDNTSSLFVGDHTRTIAKPTPSARTGIMAFAVKKLKCLGCKTPITEEEATVCAHCKPRCARGGR